MKIEDVSYYLINKSLQLVNETLDDNYLMDYNKLLFMLFLVECEYLNQNNSTLFTEDFFMSANGVAIGIQMRNTFDISLTKYLEQRLFIFEDVAFNKYTHPTFEMQFDNPTKDIMDYVMVNYAFLSLNVLKGVFSESLNLKNIYSYILIEKDKMRSLLGVSNNTEVTINRKLG